MFRAIRSLQDVLAVCPICTDVFDSDNRIPRRMPSCGQALCEPCLDTYIEGRRTFTCPLCRGNVNLPGGAMSLPKDMTLLRFLDALKTQSDAVPMCTDCPDHNKAIAKCDECGIYLCDPCVAAHARNLLTRRHKILTFEEIQTISLRQRKPRGTILPAPQEGDKTLAYFSMRMDILKGMLENVDLSKQASAFQINKRFDEMVDELQHRRAILLSEVEAKANKERKSIRRALKSHKTFQDKFTSSSAASLLQETPEDVEADRIGVAFTEVNMYELLTAIKSAGEVRLVKFRPTKRPNYVPEEAIYDAIKFDYEDFLNDADAEVTLATGDKKIIIPHLEFDQSTSSADVQISSRVVSNTRPDNAPRDTGCRFKSQRMALTLRSLPLGRGQVVVFSTRVVFTVKQLPEEGIQLWEMAVTGSPVDANASQLTGLSVRIAACSKHKQQLCLRVTYDGKINSDVPVSANQITGSRDLYLCVMLFRETNTIQVVDITENKVIAIVSNAVVDRPLWVVTSVDSPGSSEMTSELISGSRLELTQALKYHLNALTRHCTIQSD